MFLGILTPKPSISCAKLNHYWPILESMWIWPPLQPTHWWICAQFCPIWCHCWVKFIQCGATIPHSPWCSHHSQSNWPGWKCSTTSTSIPFTVNMMVRQQWSKRMSIPSWIGWSPHLGKTTSAMAGQSCVMLVHGLTMAFLSKFQRLFARFFFNFIYI